MSRKYAYILGALCSVAVASAAEYEFSGSGTLVFSNVVSSPAADDVYNYAGSTSFNLNMGAGGDKVLGSFVNENTSSTNSNYWSMYWNGGAFSINSILNDAPSRSVFRATSGAMSLDMTVGSITVKQGTLNLGDSNGGPSSLLVTDKMDLLGGTTNINLGKSYNGKEYAGSMDARTAIITVAEGSHYIRNNDVGATVAPAGSVQLGTVNFYAANTSPSLILGTSESRLASLSIERVAVSSSAAGRVPTLKIYAEETAGNDIDVLEYEANTVQTNFNIVSDRTVRIGELKASSGANQLATLTTTEYGVSVLGELKIAGGFALGRSENNAFMSVGAITGGNTSGSFRISALSSNNVVNVLTVKGLQTAGQTSHYIGRIHDYSGSATAIPTDGTGILSIVMDSSNGAVQYLAGDNYYRGDTVIKNGSLFMRADGTANKTGGGLGRIILQGGAFGACGVGTESGGLASVDAIGVVKATDLVWSGGVLNFDFDGENFDKIILSGTLKKGETSAESFVFNLSGNFAQETEYKIIEWGSMQTDFVDSDFSSNLGNVVFESRADGLYITVPEPSTYAAIFGLLALLAVYFRRRK